MRVLDVPPGEYLAEVYTYLHGVNGSSCLAATNSDEALGAYFRRTRPGMEFPLWLQNECAGDPNNDPDHKEEWKDKTSDYETEQPHYVSFLLRLTPLIEAPGLPKMDGGWIVEAQGARKPTAFPLGVVADHLVSEDES
ncbi:hypothetical protein V5E97_16980 [Singulisphaera sp. Ch08]|uniref:Uncharacterized protein n=1 Tax=Singulisphaera sp. Ch08 TaxID=3120278 RepID=A0AAU7CRE9_9BACT